MTIFSTGETLEAVIVTYNSGPDIRPCLASLQQAGVRTIVVDNGSWDDTIAIIAADFSQVRLLEAGKNLGYGSALNLGFKETASPFVLAANADTIFSANSLSELIRFLREHPKAGIAGPQQCFPNGDWQRSSGDVQGVAEALKSLMGITSIRNTVRRRAWRHLSKRPRRVGYVDGAAMMIRKVAFDEIGGFDSDFHYYCEDADLCFRMRRAGWQVFMVPDAQVTHVRGGSSTKVEGYSERLLQTQAKAYCQIVRKHHSQSYLWFYRHLCSVHAKKMKVIYGLLEAASPSPGYAPHTATRAAAFKCWARIWAEMKS